MEEAKKKGCESQENDICFIITPIGEEGSAIRKKTAGLLNNVLKPVCIAANLKAIAAHEIDQLGSITSQIIQHIVNSKLVIANLTYLNPNVMYELAIRHAVRKTVICIAEEDTNLPFDITTERTIFYTDDMYGAFDLKNKLTPMIQAALKDNAIDNPIYRAINEERIIQKVKSSAHTEDSSFQLYIIEKLDHINELLKLNRETLKSKISPTPLKKSQIKSQMVGYISIFNMSEINNEIDDSTIRTFFSKEAPGLLIYDCIVSGKVIKIWSLQKMLSEDLNKLDSFLQESYNNRITTIECLNKKNLLHYTD